MTEHLTNASSLTTSGTGITVSGVSKRFRDNHILRSLDLDVEPGSFLCLLGPSGCGKTTLLRCISGLEHPDEGVIRIGDTTVVDTARRVQVSPERRGLGMVFQQYALWPHMTVADNIAYPLRKRRVPREQRTRKVTEIAEIVGLSATLHRPPRQLSGGQQQRVALARALVHEPPALLLDEPLSNVDATLRRQLRRELRDLHDRLGTTCILVTHDQAEAAGVADVIAVVQDGRIVQSGTPREILEHPATRFVAEFVGFDNFLEGRIENVEGQRGVVALSGAGGRVEVEIAPGAAAGDTVVVAARSDTLTIDRGSVDPGDGQVSATVSRVVPHGSGVEIELDTGPSTLTVREHLRPGTTPSPGEAVTVSLPRTARAVAS
ncbi:ABC transporter ATP-binding protein [Pseudonocardia lutea]|uniref:ABC transporter ATP-binding protein n=1 Tax=Pseudonocardia lutea TaxID=2172015 RepID=A0ABW1IH36_9PSEU